MDFLHVNGISVKVVKKRIKNMYLRINKDGNIVVSAPIFMPNCEIERFVYSKADWLVGALERTRHRQQTKAQFCDGEKRALLGKEYTLHIDTTRKNGYYFKDNDIVICVGENSTIEARKKALAEVYRDAMNQILPDLAEECQKKCGLFANEWRIRDMTTRWGSCNTKEKRIWISLWLIEKPTTCIKGVIYHELAHLKVKGHNKDFYALLERIYPEYKSIEKMLKNK